MDVRTVFFILLALAQLPQRWDPAKPPGGLLQLNLGNSLHNLPIRLCRNAITARLYLIGDGWPPRPMSGIGDLRGHVRIRDKDTALAFVRLRTDPALFTCYGFESPRIVEVLDETNLPKGFGLGKYEEDVVNATRGDGIDGVFSHASFRELRIKGPTVRQDHGRFVIERDVAWFDDPYWSAARRVGRITEIVWPDGGYARMLPPGACPPEIHIRLFDIYSRADK